MPQFSTRLRDGTRRIMLTSDQYRAIEGSLSEFLAKSRAESALLCDRAGSLLSTSGAIGPDRAPLVTAIAAANYSAAAELARLIGENEQFVSHTHEGMERSLTVTAAGDSYLLISVFGKETTLGLVRTLSIRTAESIRALLNADLEPVSALEN